MKVSFNIFELNRKLAKLISKHVKGFPGTFIHFMIISFITGYAAELIMMIYTYIGDAFISEETVEKIKGHTDLKYLMQFKEARFTVYFMVAVAIATIILTLVLTVQASKVYKGAVREKYTTFGKARFSEFEEIKNSGLMQGTGIVFGKLKNRLITKAENVEGHTLIVGGPGTGKSRGIVIPTMLKWQGAALVMDIKGEISRITKDKRNGQVYIFNPESSYGDCYDPVQLCNTVDSAQELARTLIPVPTAGEPFWAQAAQGILAAYIFEGAKKGYIISDIAEKLCVTQMEKLISHCREHELREVRTLASVAYDLNDKALSGVIAEMKSKLITIATDENIRRATSKSDFTPEDLERGATIYLQVSEHLLEQYKDLWTVIISQFLRYLSKREEKKQPAILLGLDEMPRLGKIEKLTDALATLRSRNVHILQIVQSMAQLDEIYGANQRKIIADNSSFKLVLSAGDPETQKYFSDLAGQQTAMSKGITFGAGWVPNVSRSETGTPLIRPEEWAKLQKPILFIPRLYPVPLDLAFWDKEKM